MRVGDGGDPPVVADRCCGGFHTPHPSAALLGGVEDSYGLSAALGEGLVMLLTGRKRSGAAPDYGLGDGQGADCCALVKRRSTVRIRQGALLSPRGPWTSSQEALCTASGSSSEAVGLSGA